jgi:hypothetical protein
LASINSLCLEWRGRNVSRCRSHHYEILWTSRIWGLERRRG